MCFVNKMDRIGADFFRCVDMIKDRLGSNPLVLQLPIGAESNYEGLVDLVKMQEVLWKAEDLGAEYEYVDIRDSLKDQADEYRAAMVEAVVELDDDVMEAYLEGNEPDEETLIRLIRKGTIEQNFAELNGTAFENKGAQPQDAVVDYMPSPLDVEAINVDAKRMRKRYAKARTMCRLAPAFKIAMTCLSAR